MEKQQTDLDTSRSYYDAFSESYESERHHGYHAWLDRTEIDLVLRHVSPSARLLEAGCGTGLILKSLKSQSKQAFGIDLSRGMLSHARRKDLPVAQAAIHQLPFSNATFDAVCSFKVLAHIPPIRETLLEFDRVLRPGGVLIAEFYNPFSFRGLIKRLKRPTPIADQVHDEVVYTRYDSLSQIKSYLPASMELEAYYGIRVWTVFSQLHRIPVLSSIVRFLENTSLSFPGLRRLGGFLVVVARKKGGIPHGSAA